MNRSMRAGSLLLLITVIGISTMGFQCSSPNVTGGKLYIQQYDQSKDVKKLDLAIESFQKELNQNPNSAEAWYWIGLANGLKKDYLKLQEAWTKSLALGPVMKSEIESRAPGVVREAIYQGQNTLQKAQIKKDKALYTDAANYFLAANRLLPDTAAKFYGFYNFALAQLNLGDQALAVSSLEEQVKRFPMAGAYKLLGDLIMNEGQTLNKENKTDQAKEKFTRALTVLEAGSTAFPENADISGSLLSAYIMTGRAQEARVKFKSFADANPKDRNAQYAFGTLCLETKDYDNAVAYLDKAITIDGKYENALYNISVSYFRWGIKVRDEAQAKDDMNVGTAYKDIILKAVPYATKLNEIKVDDQAYVDLLAKIFASVGDANKAKEWFEKLDKLKATQK